MEQAQSLPPHSLADALGDVRAEIRALKAREAALRQALIAARPNGPVAGQRYEVSIRESRRRVLDRDRLPESILGDDRFWKTSISQTVVTRACDASRTTAANRAPARAGRTANEPALDLWGQDTEPVLIEDF